jgi:hypothetical protein
MSPPFLFVIAQHERERVDFVRYHFGGEPEVEVILDRRGRERRDRRAAVPIERRHQDRRQYDVSQDLRAVGWAYVRRADLAATVGSPEDAGQRPA